MPISCELKRPLAALFVSALFFGFLWTAPSVGALGGYYWVRMYPGSAEGPQAVSISPSGDVFVVGTIDGLTLHFGAGGFELSVLKLKENGSVEWEKAYGRKEDDGGNAVVATPDGGAIVAGSSGDGTWILRLDSNGSVRWQRLYKSRYGCEPMAVALAPNGDIIVAGIAAGFEAEYGWVLRLDENGRVLWSKLYAIGRGNCWFTSVVVAPNGDIITVGGTQSLGSDDAWVLRLDQDGSIKWGKVYGGEYSDGASAVAVGYNGDIIVVGAFSTNRSVGSTDAWVFRLDSEGNVEWQRLYGGTMADGAYHLRITNDGDIIVVGDYGTFGGWVLRLNPWGSVVWQEGFNGNASGTFGGGVSLAPNGDIIIAGQLYRETWLIRMPQSGRLPACNFCRPLPAHYGESNATVKIGNAAVHDYRLSVSSPDFLITNLTFPYKTLYLSPGYLIVSSKPEGASLYLNGSYRGRTPITVQLPQGSYRVRLTMEGHSDYVTNIGLEPGQVINISVILHSTQTKTTGTKSESTASGGGTGPSTSTPKTTASTSGEKRGICGPALLMALTLLSLLAWKKT